MNIINLTQHPASPEQKSVGVTEPLNKAEIKNLLTFEEIPTGDEIVRRAIQIAEIAAKEGADVAMIGGAPYLMSALEHELKKLGIAPIYAFSKRECVEQTLPDGSVKKTTVFKHCGFVTIY